MEALVEDNTCWPKKKKWLEVLDFMFHTTGEHPMVDVWIPRLKISRNYSLIFIHGFREKNDVTH